MKMGVFFTLGNTPISAVKLYFSTLRTYPTVQSANHIARWCQINPAVRKHLGHSWGMLVQVGQFFWGRGAGTFFR